MRATRRIVWRAPWSALAVTEHVFTTTRSACSAGLSMAPRTRRSSSTRSGSAWVTRQPKVMIEYFTSSGLQFPRRGLHLVRQLLLVVHHFLGHRRVADGENLRREDAGVGRAGFPDGHGGDGHAGRHLDGRQQRVE